MPAKKGNTNALKHGFYSRKFTKEQNLDLDHSRPDAQDEIACLRTHANRVNAWLLEKDPGEIDEAYFAAVNTLVNLNIAIGTLLRTQALINGRSSNIEKSIQDAILSGRDRWILA